jgi:hypothetical protein
MNVNEHERLSNLNICFYCCFTFKSHSSVSYNEHNSYSTMDVKQPFKLAVVPAILGV